MTSAAEVGSLAALGLKGTSAAAEVTIIDTSDAKVQFQGKLKKE